VHKKEPIGNGRGGLSAFKQVWQNIWHVIHSKLKNLRLLFKDVAEVGEDNTN
jgi:hypothetical protein